VFAFVSAVRGDPAKHLPPPPAARFRSKKPRLPAVFLAPRRAPRILRVLTDRKFGAPVPARLPAERFCFIDSNSERRGLIELSTDVGTKAAEKGRVHRNAVMFYSGFRVRHWRRSMETSIGESD